MCCVEGEVGSLETWRCSLCLFFCLFHGGNFDLLSVCLLHSLRIQIKRALIKTGLVLNIHFTPLPHIWRPCLLFGPSSVMSLSVYLLLTFDINSDNLTLFPSQTQTLYNCPLFLFFKHINPHPQRPHQHGQASVVEILCFPYLVQLLSKLGCG